MVFHLHGIVYHIIISSAKTQQLNALNLHDIATCSIVDLCAGIINIIILATTTNVRMVSLDSNTAINNQLC